MGTFEKKNTKKCGDNLLSDWIIIKKKKDEN